VKTICIGLSAASLFALTLLAGCGSENSLVGGRCRDGMVLQGDECVSPPPQLMIIMPTSPPTLPSANVDPTEPVRNPFPIDPIAHPPSFVDPTPPPFPHDLVCAAPLVACRGECISVTSDPQNCGACGKICPSNICVNGLCQGAMPGDVVLIGHDYTNANAGSAQAKVLANALSIPTTDPIRVLSYEDGAPAQTVAQAKTVAEAAIYGRTVSFVRAASAAALTATDLDRNYDIVLIHDASAGDPVAVGASWSAALGEFTVRGGVVVALDRGTSPMPQLLTSSGLLTVGGHTMLPAATHLVVSDAADVVGAQVLSPYAGFGPPVSFQGVLAASLDFDWVIRSTVSGTPSDPVVIHRIVR
jgi:hypothetical protein